MPGRRRRSVDLEPLVLTFEKGGSHLREIWLIGNSAEAHGFSRGRKRGSLM